MTSVHELGSSLDHADECLDERGLNPGMKRLEIGYFNTRLPLTVYLVFECFPVWLLSLDPSWVSTLVICGYKSLSEFLLLYTIAEKDLLSLLLANFHRQDKISFSETAIDEPVPDSIILLSGSLFPYLVTLVRKYSSSKFLGVVDSHFQGRLRNGHPTSQSSDNACRDTGVTWHRCRHTTFGGATEFMALFVRPNSASEPKSSNLKRGIRHFFSSSIRPGPPPKNLPLDRKGHYYGMDDRLCPGLYSLPVLCPSHFHASGTGYRVLSIAVLAAVHGFPRQFVHPNFPSHLLTLPPCQLLAAYLDSMWHIPSVSTVIDGHLGLLKRPQETHTWIPSLKRSLSHVWIDESLVTATASKADDAVLPCHLWDARLECLFPGCTPHLPAIRNGILIWIRRRLWREIRLYLHTTFGATWATDLCLGRRVVGGKGPSQGQKRGKTYDAQDLNNLNHVHDGVNYGLSLGYHGLSVENHQDENQDGLRVEHHQDENQDEHQEVRRTKRVSFLGLTTEEEPLTTTKFSPGTRKVSRSMQRRLNTQDGLHMHDRRGELMLEADKVSEVLEKICWCSWWEWEIGSALFFWRWGENCNLARDGMVPFISSELPTNTKKGRSLANNEHIAKITEKLSTILRRGYINPGKVESLIDFFAVPKGEDIRVVYNGTSCGLNEATWAPNFWLPYPRTAIGLLDYSYHSVDVDLGEMFLNFPLHKSIQASSGIDLSPFQANLGLGGGTNKTWYRWTRNWMGARMSPYSSVQFCSIAEEFCRGNRLDATNPLRWDIIVLNLPGSPTYDPSKPRVYKWDKTMGCLAGELVIFVDDCRATAKTIELAWQIARQVCSRFQYLGIQDATRKRKPPTKTPGAWAGSVFAATDEAVTKTVTADKWKKAQHIIEVLNSKILEGGAEAELGYNELEVARGFLCHLSMTYEVMVPFLKGFHLCLANHLGQRDDDGWKLTDKAWQSYIYGLEEASNKNNGNSVAQEIDKPTGLGDKPIPTKVKVSQHLRNDLQALAKFVGKDSPPIINDRSALVQIVRYGFGDASGTGFGSTIETSQGLKYRVGVWGSDEESESSNYKQLENVVSTIEDEAAAGNLKKSSLFFFTDNSTVEAALFKGNSASRKLFELVVRFRSIELEYGMQVTVSHISGRRMIEQGTDGVSRGNMTEGIGSGMNMLQFIPLHLGALDRHEGLLDWIKYWAGNSLEVLSPSDWFTRGHDHFGGTRDKAGFWRVTTKPGIFLWAPPPAAAEAAIEQLRRALIKRQCSTHIIVCPRLLTTEWQKQLHKAADLVISLPAGRDDRGWPSDMYEPLTIAFVFPFFSHKPWKRRSTPKMLDVGRVVSRMWKEGKVDSRDFLRKFFKDQSQLTNMPECLVRKVLYFQR